MNRHYSRYSTSDDLQQLRQQNSNLLFPLKYSFNIKVWPSAKGMQLRQIIYRHPPRKNQLLWIVFQPSSHEIHGRSLFQNDHIEAFFSFIYGNNRCRRGSVKSGTSVTAP
jgi:hypothetical protein